MPILTPNIMMFGQPNHVPEEDPDDIEDTNMRRRARFLENCKQKIWSRWNNEYLRGLRERHNLIHNGKSNNIAIGDVMLIKGDARNRAKWNYGIVTKLISGRDGVVRGVKLRAGKDHLERAVQHLYPMELRCDISDRPSIALNVHAPSFRPNREAATISKIRTKEHLELEDSVPIVEY